jgi:hypothetical protein
MINYTNSAVTLSATKFSNISDVLFVLIKDPSQLPLTLSKRAINLNVRRSVLLSAMYFGPSNYKT